MDASKADFSTSAIHLAKHAFHVCAATAEGVTVFNSKCSRSKPSQLLATRPTCLVATEPWATGHYWGRETPSQGHVVRLIPPFYVKPFVKRIKNAANDAAAVALAVCQPNMYCPTGRALITERALRCRNETRQKAQAMLFRTHKTFTRQRSQLLVTLRRRVAEQGVIGAKASATLIS